MVHHEGYPLPTEDELNVQEVNLSGPALRAGSAHLGKYCQWTYNEFILCRNELQDPRACQAEGREVTNCALSFFRLVKKSCHDEFTQHARCLDQSSSDNHFRHCRTTQGVYDKCMLENLNLERPDFGHLARAQIHETKRPKPPTPPKSVYDDLPAKLPDDAPRPEAKYGGRWMVFH